MATCATLIDETQLLLGDSTLSGTDGQIWSRAEILDALNDGYRALLTQSQAVRRWTILETPPQYTMTGDHEWEGRFVKGGTFWCHNMVTEGYSAEHLWEVQVLEGVEPEASGGHVDHEWERIYATSTHQHYRFALPRDSERIAGLWYDHRRLQPIQVRDLDSMERHWMSIAGYPMAWTPGIGRLRTFELYEIITTDQRGYALVNTPWGIPRYRTGSRTYATGLASGDLYGVPRRIMSPDRQYLATHGVWGLPRNYHTSVGNVLILEVIGPEVPDILEEDTPALLPAQMHKYLRYFALAQLWNRQGEGYRPDLAGLCSQVFTHGVQVLKNLGWITMHDEQMARNPGRMRQNRLMPHAQLPSTYPRVP